MHDDKEFPIDADAEPQPSPLAGRSWVLEIPEGMLEAPGIGVFKGKKAMMAAVYGYPAGGSELPGLLQIHGGDFRPGLVVDRVRGGVDVTSGAPGSGAYAVEASPSVPTGGDYEMHHSVGFVDGAEPYTWIRLQDPSQPGITGPGSKGQGQILNFGIPEVDPLAYTGLYVN